MKSNTIYQTVGNTVAQWKEESPLRWTMREPAREGGFAPDPIACDLSSLTSGYEEGFLLALKDALISSRHRLAMTSVKSNSYVLVRLLELVHTKGFDGKGRVNRIEPGFLAALHALADEIPPSFLKMLKGFHKSHRGDDRLFESGLQPGDFPISRDKRGVVGARIHKILATALHRSTLVHILDVVEAAFEEKRIDLARYAFTRLALNIFCRPESYRRLTLADLRVDRNPQTGAVKYFLDVLPAKNRVHNPEKIHFGLHPEVGRLLAMQRQGVVEEFGHMAPMGSDGPDHQQFALFPAGRLRIDGSTWVSAYSNANAGRLTNCSFCTSYIVPIKKLTRTKLSFNALRHTIGTQLAQMGCSAHTIQAVLKHATDSTCKAYVDIVFEGLIDELSDGLKPSFDEHFPVINAFVSTSDAIPPERRIESKDLEAARDATTGMCGRHVACNYAPITCYACPRFIPCYDADHSINLNVVEREIEAAKGLGLAMQHDVKRWKTIRNHIRVVAAACDNKRRALDMEAAAVMGGSS